MWCVFYTLAHFISDWPAVPVATMLDGTGLEQKLVRARGLEQSLAQ